MKKTLKEAKKVLYEQRRMFHENKDDIEHNVHIDLGRRSLFFSQTFDDQEFLVHALLDENDDKLNVGINVHYPQVLIEKSGGRLKLDPSVCFRLELSKYNAPKKRNLEISFRMLSDEPSDIEQINAIYKNYGMFEIDQETLRENQYKPAANYYVAVDGDKILGTVIGVNHVELFTSASKGASLWGLAVLPDDKCRGIGSILIDYLVGHFQTKGLTYIDLYVDFSNKKAIGLYEKLGFRRIQRFYVVNKGFDS